MVVLEAHLWDVLSHTVQYLTLFNLFLPQKITFKYFPFFPSTYYGGIQQ